MIRNVRTTGSKNLQRHQERQVQILRSLYGQDEAEVSQLRKGADSSDNSFCLQGKAEQSIGGKNPYGRAGGTNEESL